RYSALHVSHGLNDLSVTNAHDIDASNPVRFVFAPAKLPAEDRAVAHRGDFLNFEIMAGGRRQALPEGEAGIATFVARTIWRWRRIFENAAFADEIVEFLGAMIPKGIIEAFHD